MGVLREVGNPLRIISFSKIIQNHVHYRIVIMKDCVKLNNPNDYGGKWYFA